MKSSKKIYLILNDDETLFLDKRREPMIYRKIDNFINQKRFKGCKVAIFQLTDIEMIQNLKYKAR